jgi:hypothetical protein
MPCDQVTMRHFRGACTAILFQLLCGTHIQSNKPLTNEHYK